MFVWKNVKFEMIIMNKILLIFFFSIILAGCSNKQLYRAGQNYQKSKCVEATSGQQYNDCLNMHEKTYEEYNKERKSIINK